MHKLCQALNLGFVPSRLKAAVPFLPKSRAGRAVVDDFSPGATPDCGWRPNLGSVNVRSERWQPSIGQGATLVVPVRLRPRSWDQPHLG